MSNLRGPDGAKGRRAGGIATMSKPAPEWCKHCQKWGYRKWSQHLGHLGAQAAADSMGISKEDFLMMGVAMQDPFPENGVYARWHAMVLARQEDSQGPGNS